MMSGSMVDRPTFSIIDKETGKYIINPGKSSPKSNRFYLSPSSALREFYVNLNSVICDIIHGYVIHGYLSGLRKELVKKISRPIAVKNDFTQEIIKNDLPSSKIRMTLKNWLVEDGPMMHPIIVEDYINGTLSDDVYVTIMVNCRAGEVPPHNIIRVSDMELNHSKMSRLMGTSNKAIIYSKFKDKDDLVMWKLNQTILIDEIIIEGVDKFIKSIKTVEEDFGISFKEM